MKNLILTLTAVVWLCLSTSAQDWQLIWSDEFNGTSLDLNNWSYETGTGVNGDFGTGQLDRATDRVENVDIEQGINGADGGALRITTRKEFYVDRDYTSGRINTAGKQSWGPNHRIVARVWPQDVRYMGQGFAFWMMPDEMRPGDDHLSWPQGGEVDIMEYVGSLPWHNLGSVHYAWDWNGNEWAAWNHAHHGGYYSYHAEQVPDGIEWYQVDLGSVLTINRVVMNWENTGKTFEIQISTDASNWTTVHLTPDGDGGIDDITFGNASAQFVRMYGTQRSNDWGYSLYEFEVYAPGSGTNLALNRPVSASSSQGDDVGPQYAVDGNVDTRWSSWGRDPGYQCCEPSPQGDPYNGANGWHEYGIDWYADRMEFFIDNNVYHIHYFNDGAAFAKDGENEVEVQKVDGRNVKKSEFSNLYPEWHPFEHKMYAILSAGVGGGGQTYGGPIVDPAEFPVDVYIDWVRVYSNGEEYNPPPVVSLTSPSGTETYAAPANITLTAAASDRDGGTVSSVTFYNGGQVIGTDNTAPFMLEWNNVSAGNYELRAVATDNGGVTSESQVVEVAVNDASSNLALNRPGTASTVTGEFHASLAFDNDPTTRWESLYEDPQWIYVDLGNSYNVNRVNILWEPAMASDYQVQVSANASDWQTIRTVSGNNQAVNDLTGLNGTGRYVRIYGTSRLTQYGYSILSMEVFGAGNFGNQLPSINLTSPGQGSLHASPASLSIAADASDPDGFITQVEFLNGNTSLFVDNAAPFAYTWTGIPEGTYTIIAKATDNSGATRTATPIVVTVADNSNQSPTANAGIDQTIQLPTNSVSLAGSGTDADGSIVSYLWTKVSGGGATIANPGSASTQVNDLSEGTYVFRLTVTDDDQSTDSDEVTIVVNPETQGCGSTNIAIGKPVATSSIQGDYTGVNAVDGDPNSRWGTGFSDDEWIRVDLEGTFNICRVVLSWEAAFGSDYEIRLGATDDLNASALIASVTNGDGGIDDIGTNASPSGRYLWMRGIARGTGWGYSLWEMEVYGGSGDENQGPVANAGDDISLAAGAANATLNGSGSSDPDGDALTYLWEQISGPSVGIDNTANPVTGIQGLTNGASYSFRLTVGDGQLSSIDEVTVTVANGGGCGTTNIALNRPALASSQEGDFSAGNAFDGDIGTRWGSAFSDDEWLRVDFGTNYHICEVILHWEGAYGSDYEIRLGASDDINASTLLVTVNAGDGGTDQISNNASASGRYLWMKGLSRGTPWGYSLYEMEVFGFPATDRVLTTIDLSPAMSVVNLGETVQYTALTYDQYGDPINETVNWMVEGNCPGCIDSNGLFKALTEGMYSVIAYGGPGPVVEYASITVNGNPTQNLALGKPVTVSSVEGPWAAGNANDGDMGTRWGSEFTDDEWLMIDLESTYSITNVKIFWEGAFGSDYDIRLGSTTDLTSAAIIGTVNNGDGGEDDVQTNGGVSGRYLWMNGISRATGWGYSIFEIEAYGNSAGARLSQNQTELAAKISENSIKVYPNPASNQLTIEFEEFKSGDRLEIVSLTGKRILEAQVNSNLQALDISRFQPGMYILRLAGSNSRSVMIVKQ